MKNLVYWWLFFWLQGIGIGFAAYFGVFSTVIRTDTSYLSVVIFVLFFFTTCWIGLMTLRKAYGTVIAPNYSLGWFLSELCMMLGMIGTVVGFIFTLVKTLGSGVSFSDAAALQAVVADLARGVGTAAWTTLFGLIAAASIKLQMLNLENTRHE